MRGLISSAGYVPYRRLRLDTIPASVGGPGRGTRAVASWDEDATTMAVAAARNLVDGGAAAKRLLFASATPTYLDRTNATTVHAALRLPSDVLAADAGGAARSSAAAVLTALDSRLPTLVVAADVRTGRPGSQDERETGDAGVALLIGNDADGVLVAEHLGSASATREFLDRYRLAGESNAQRWEERFGEGEYLDLALEAWPAACKDADLAGEDVDALIVTGLHTRAAGRVGRKLAGGRDVLVDDRRSTVGQSGSAHPWLLLTDWLEGAPTGAVVGVVSLADGVDVTLWRSTGTGSGARTTVAQQVADGSDDLDYLRFLTWRGQLEPEPPRRPAPARASGTAAARNRDWKYGFVGSRNRETGALALPPQRVAWDDASVDQMDPAPMADVAATIRTFTVDHLSWSPSPPTVFAVLDFDATDDGPGGRYACALTDLDPDQVAIGDCVRLTFRRLGESEGVVNYFWKAAPLRGEGS